MFGPVGLAARLAFLVPGQEGAEFGNRLRLQSLLPLQQGLARCFP